MAFTPFCKWPWASIVRDGILDRSQRALPRRSTHYEGGFSPGDPPPWSSMEQNDIPAPKPAPLSGTIEQSNGTLMYGR